MCLRTGPGDLKNTKHLKSEIRQIFYALLKNGKKFTNFDNFENRQQHTFKSLYAFFYLNLVGKKPTELDQTILLW